MPQFKMPSKCSLCGKSCDGKIWCSENCRNTEVNNRGNKEVLDNFFSKLLK